jgi:hypothetical protein
MTILMAVALLAAASEQPEPVNVPDPEAIRTMHEFSACVVREQTAEARATLVMDFRTRAYQRRLQHLARSTDTCFRRGRLGMSGVNFAGSLAEQLYLRDYRGADAVALVSAAAPEDRSRTEALANCVVRHSPAAARAVLDTAVTTAEEANALDALRPAIAACLQGADEAQFNRPGLRSLVALALFHAARLRSAER